MSIEKYLEDLIGIDPYFGLGHRLLQKGVYPLQKRTMNILKYIKLDTHLESPIE